MKIKIKKLMFASLLSSVLTVILIGTGILSLINLFCFYYLADKVTVPSAGVGDVIIFLLNGYGFLSFAFGLFIGWFCYLFVIHKISTVFNVEYDGLYNMVCKIIENNKKW